KMPFPKLKLKGQAGTVIGFDVAVDDGDVPSRGRKLQMVWSGTAHNWRTPVDFGRIILVK
ncbi:MAG: hypothetical protein JXN60_05835, partial [Lentisphaerae bacterium]|nr:hypothetical protein [Lentisphaerota bacterium]